MGTYTDTFGMEYAYMGDLKDGKPNGRGKGVFSDGTVYDGLWIDGNRAPHKEIPKDLRTRVKQSTDKRDNLMSKVKDMEKGSTGTTQGYGTYTDTFGREYAYMGELKDGKPNGRGRGALNDGTVYEGLWMDGKKCGHGTLTYSNGNAYEGNGRRERRAILVDACTKVNGWMASGMEGVSSCMRMVA